MSSLRPVNQMANEKHFNRLDNRNFQKGTQVGGLFAKKKK
jgi:hypothetical protein